MADVLQEICTKKAEHVAACKARISLAELKEKIINQEPPRGFAKALKNCPHIPLIAEVKKASPSKGVIRKDFDAPAIAKIYEHSGAACLSVLTDEPYFQGHDDYLKTVRKAVALPVLRKDFMIDPYQIYESRALGADCILLIVAALDDGLMKEMNDLALDLGMDVLVETHNAEEIERAKALSPQIIGVNNRNLKTLEVNVKTSFDLIKSLPKESLKISESGLYDHATLQDLQVTGYNGFLIGESLMKQNNIAKATKNILFGA